MTKEELSSTEKGLLEVFTYLNNWVNNETLDGSVQAWRERLSIESKEHFRTASSLRHLAIYDRKVAVDVALELKQWDLLNDGSEKNQDLVRTIATLIQFPQKGELEECLLSLSIPLGEVKYEGEYEVAFFAENFMECRGVAIRFDCEAIYKPNRHDLLMEELVASSGLKLATFSEIAPGDDDHNAKYQLKAIINGKSYNTLAENHGGWYDYLCVINFLNEIASDQGLTERFVMLHTGDQMACVWWSEPKLVASLLKEGLIVLAEENQSLKVGMVFEQKMLNQLNAST